GAVESALSALSKELVGAVCASTAPAASTRAFACDARRCTFVSSAFEFGRPVGSAYGALCAKHRGGICAPTGWTVVDLRWGIAPRAPVQGGGNTTVRSMTTETIPMIEHDDWFVGIDWGYDAHHLCLVDAAGRLHGTRRVTHDAPAIA